MSGENTYSLQISVDNAEVVHIPQAICNISQLDNESVRPQLESSATRTSSMRFTC